MVLDSEGESEEREDTSSLDQGLELISRAMALARFVLADVLDLTKRSSSSSSFLSSSKGIMLC